MSKKKFMGSRNYHLGLSGYGFVSAATVFLTEEVSENWLKERLDKNRKNRKKIAEPLLRDKVGYGELRESQEMLEESLNKGFDQSYLFTRWRHAPELNSLMKSYVNTGSEKGFDNFVSSTKQDFRRLDAFEHEFACKGFSVAIWLSMGLALVGSAYHARKAFKKKDKV